jgi:hypothetical protein
MRTVRIEVDPQIVLSDIDGDSQLEIVCADHDDHDRLVVLDAAGKRKAWGPSAPAGALAAADLNGDGRPEIVFLDTDGRLAAFASTHKVLSFDELVRPLRSSTVGVAHAKGEQLPRVVYVDADGRLRSIRLGESSRAMTDLSNAVDVGPGMEVSDFDGDGLEEVCYLRRRLSYRFPLCLLSIMDGGGDSRDLPVAPPLGPRASGRLHFPWPELPVPWTFYH